MIECIKCLLSHLIQVFAIKMFPDINPTCPLLQCTGVFFPAPHRNCPATKSFPAESVGMITGFGELYLVVVVALNITFPCTRTREYKNKYIHINQKICKHIRPNFNHLTTRRVNIPGHPGCYFPMCLANWTMVVYM